MRPDKSAHPFLKMAIPALLMLSSISVILLAYFFYDIMGGFDFFVALDLFVKTIRCMSIGGFTLRSEGNSLLCTLVSFWTSFPLCVYGLADSVMVTASITLFCCIQ